MNNISDKLIITIILITILFVFGLIFSVKSPERKVLDSPIIWKDDYSNISLFRNNKINSEIHYLPEWEDPIEPYIKNIILNHINLSFHF